jgi:hypothetical protein
MIYPTYTLRVYDQNDQRVKRLRARSIIAVEVPMMSTMVRCIFLISSCLVLLVLVTLMYGVVSGHMQNKVREIPHRERVVLMAWGDRNGCK